jgi:CubicO group peptidase (beta-lactamase class C family)
MVRAFCRGEREKRTARRWGGVVSDEVPAEAGGFVADVAAGFAAGSQIAGYRLEEQIEVIPWRNIDNIAPAGSINSNVVDMSQWVRLQLGEGVYKGQRLISSGGAKEMHTAQTVIRMDPPWTLFYSDAHFLNYGLGWFLHDHRGRRAQ